MSMMNQRLLIHTVIVLVGVASFLSMADAEESYFEKETILQRGERTGAYAIPKMVTLPDDTALIVFQDREGGDWGKVILPCVIRSTDRGATWSSPKPLVPEGDVAFQNAVVKPTGIVIDAIRNTVLVFVSRSPLHDAAGKPIHEKDFYRDIQGTRAAGRAWFLLRSEDGGETWSPPVDITEALIKKPHWQEWSPVHTGIQLSYGENKGRLVVPVRCYCPDTAPREHDWKYQSNATIYSDDGGKTWLLGERTGPYLGEAAIAERENGTVVMNQRALPGRDAVRWISESHDGGVTFDPPVATSLSDVRCHVGLVRTSTGDIDDSEWLLLTSIPGDKRQGLSLSVNERAGSPWKTVREIESGHAAYSDLAVLSDGTLLCVYETGEHTSRKDLALARFNGAWVKRGMAEQLVNNRAYMERLFSTQNGEEVYAHVLARYEGHLRLYGALVGESNLGSFDPGTNANPHNFTGGDSTKLPDDAIVQLDLSKEEYVALKVPYWDDLELGGANSNAYLGAWMAYQRYEVARLQAELLSHEASPDEAKRRKLQEEMSRQREVVMDYLLAPPAD